MMQSVIYMPTKDGHTEPAPHVLTDEEVARFCRLDCANVDESLRRYREKGWLRPVQIGRSLRYRLPDVVKFLDKIQSENPR